MLLEPKNPDSPLTQTFNSASVVFDNAVQSTIDFIQQHLPAFLSSLPH